MVFGVCYYGVDFLFNQVVYCCCCVGDQVDVQGVQYQCFYGYYVWCGQEYVDDGVEYDQGNNVRFGQLQVLIEVV